MNGRGAAPTVSALGPAETARAVRTAVVDGDVDALHSELCRIRNDLVDHPHDGGATPAPEHAPEAVLRLVRHGRQHLLHLVGELLLTTSAGGQDCTCLARAGELSALLARQARLEARLVRYQDRLTSTV